MDDWLRPLISNAILALTTEHSAILARNTATCHNSSSRKEPSQCRSATATILSNSCQTLLATGWAARTSPFGDLRTPRVFAKCTMQLTTIAALSSDAPPIREQKAAAPTSP